MMNIEQKYFLICNFYFYFCIQFYFKKVVLIKKYYIEYVLIKNKYFQFK